MAVVDVIQQLLSRPADQRRLGPFLLVEPLGRGGFAPVWRALELHGETVLREVAIKLFAISGANEGARSEIVAEAQALCRVEHPNVVHFYALPTDEAAGVMGLAMELVAGTSLQQTLPRCGQLPWQEVARVGEAIASALTAVHRAGLVHRDVKPGNVVQADGAYKLIDFGIAAAEKRPERGGDEEPRRVQLTDLPNTFAGSKMSALAKTASAPRGGFVSGTIGYIDPVCVSEGRRAGPGSDLYGLGALLFECLTGRLPAAAAMPRGAGLSGAVLDGREPPPPVLTLAADAPERLAKLVDALLSPRPEDRPASAEDVVRTLRELALPAEERQSREAPRPRRGLALGVAAVTFVGLGLGLYARLSPPPAPRPQEPLAAVSPLADSQSVLACPPLRVVGLEEPSGWLGAAAASVVCERARLMLGGRPERTLVPAELLALPRAPSESFPADPYDAEDARERAVTAARQATAWVDGVLTRSSEGFHLSLEVRAKDGAPFARGEGSAPSLAEAARLGMEAFRRPEVLATATALDPVVADWSRATTVSSGLALLDVTLAMAQNAGSLPAACARLQGMADDVREHGPGERYRCAYTLGLAETSVPLPALDSASPAGLAAASRVRLMLDGNADYAAAAARLAGFLAAPDLPPWGRSTLAATTSCLFQAAEPERARELALAAVQAQPKNPDGQFCNPWGQLLAVTRGTTSADATTHAMQAWVPWDANAWLFEGGEPARRRRFARRAYLLSPYDAYVADGLAGGLLTDGSSEEARAIASALVSGGRPVHEVGGNLLLLRVEASEARFGAALSRGLREMEPHREDAGWVRMQRLELAFRTLEVAEILGRAGEVADAITRQFLLPEPSPVDPVYLTAPLRLAAVCALASKPVSGPCFDRLEALSLTGQVPESKLFTAGARRYAEGDLRGAASAWRSLLRSPETLPPGLAGPMTEVFEAVGEPALVERIDGLLADERGKYHGASLADVRAAKRAFRRGDQAKAQAESTRVLAAWELADDEVPAVGELRALLAK
jgi:serine/threonine protein kinase